MENVRAHVVFSGRVQGVNFRSFTAQAARASGAKGWVRNLPDGRVEAVFEGPRQAVDDAIGASGKGPSYARVDDVDVTWQDFKGEFYDFSVRY